jgi:hypothetical protein
MPPTHSVSKTRFHGESIARRDLLSRPTRDVCQTSEAFWMLANLSVDDCAISISIVLFCANDRTVTSQIPGPPCWTSAAHSSCFSSRPPSPARTGYSSGRLRPTICSRPPAHRSHCPPHDTSRRSAELLPASFRLVLRELVMPRLDRVTSTRLRSSPVFTNAEGRMSGKRSDRDAETASECPLRRDGGVVLDPSRKPTTFGRSTAPLAAVNSQ